MSSSFTSPQAFKTSAKARLNQRAKELGFHPERMWRMFLFERFLHRLTLVLGETFLLKGGFALEMRLESARSTRDIDIWFGGAREAVLLQLQEAGRLEGLDDFLVFEVAHGKDLGAPGMRYGGDRYHVEPRLAGKSQGGFHIDVGVADAVHGSPEVLLGLDVLADKGIPPIRQRVYPIETHLAEKLHGYTWSGAPDDGVERESRRLRDLPDIALLASLRPIESTDLRAAIHKTFGRRKTHPIPPALPRPPAGQARAYAHMVDEWQLPWATLDALHQAAEAFIMPPLLGGAGRWDPNTWAWLP